MVISMLASIATVQCGTILASPVIGKLVSEKVIESHGNNVVHSATVPLAVAASPALLRYATDVALVPQEPIVESVQPLAKASLVAERTIEAHGHRIVHNAHPLVAVRPLTTVESHVAIPTIAARGLTYAAPIYYSTYPHQLIAEKTVSSYGHSVQHVA
ncbi:phage tail protein [Lasius niger]|uniref:Phage tail protein n=1 Tax=Lasius niger TaxID=67767 RepID=A0A0J7NWT1_LASNI|nr:phage tail protein [Lasius niger]